MGQKVNPHGLRVGVIKNWDSRWFVNAKDFGDTIVSDHKIREYVKTKLQGAGVPKVEIERDAARVRVFIQCAKPGVVIGFHGAEIEKLRAELEAMVGPFDQPKLRSFLQDSSERIPHPHSKNAALRFCQKHHGDLYRRRLRFPKLLQPKLQAHHRRNP